MTTTGPTATQARITPESTVTPDDAITVQGLIKTYGDRRAVDGLSFSVRRGEIFALLGPNGAGKTTTVEILEGYRAPDGGQVRVLGLDPIREGSALKPRIGVMLQNGGIYPQVTAHEILDLFRHFYPDPADPEQLLDLVGLTDSGDVQYRQLSGGQQRRLALAAALIGRPALLFLDEPTTAMDPQARHMTWDILQDLRRQGLTIVLTTHFMEEAELLADRVAIIDHGRLLTLDSPAALTRGSADGVRFTGPAGLDVPALVAALPSATGGHEEGTGTYVIATSRPPDLLAEVTAWARDRGILLNDIRVGHESLEDVFLRLTGHALRE